VAKKTIKAMDVEIGGVDYSDQISSAQLVVNLDTSDVTTFGDDGAQKMVGGIIRGNVNITFQKDADLSVLDADLWSKLGEEVAVNLLLDGDAAIGVTNPEFQGTFLVNGHEFGGGVGQPHSHSVSWPVSGAITRATA